MQPASCNVRRSSAARLVSPDGARHAPRQRCAAGLILPDKASLVLCAIEDAEYKAEKIDCERSPARPIPVVVVCGSASFRAARAQRIFSACSARAQRVAFSFGTTADSAALSLAI